MQALSERLSSESGRLDLAVRFVDWFSRRGEAYEHNLRVIDKHLHHLTDGVHPADRPPFSSLVRINHDEFKQ